MPSVKFELTTSCFRGKRLNRLTTRAHCREHTTTRLILYTLIVFNWDVILYKIFYQQVLPLVRGCQQMTRLLRQALHLQILTPALHQIFNLSPPTRLALARILLSFSAFLIQTQNRSTTLVIVMTWEFVINFIIICFISIMFSISYSNWLIVLAKFKRNKQKTCD